MSVTRFVVVIGLTTFLLCHSFLVAYCSIRYARYRSFQQSMKAGDLCFYYSNETKIKGRITRVAENQVKVENEERQSLCFPRNELYPN